MSDTAKRTPGPWHWSSNPEGGSRLVHSSTYAPVLPGVIAVRPAEADANLIAAAPDLLAELESLWSLHGHEWSRERANRVLALIARAEGATT